MSVAEAFRWSLLVVWNKLKDLFVGGGQKLFLSARGWVLCVLLVIAALVAYYVLSDRYTPFTTDAFVQAFVIQVTARVEGQVVRVDVLMWNDLSTPPLRSSRFSCFLLWSRPGLGRSGFRDG